MIQSFNLSQWKSNLIVMKILILLWEHIGSPVVMSLGSFYNNYFISILKCKVAILVICYFYYERLFYYLHHIEWEKGALDYPAINSNVAFTKLNLSSSCVFTLNLHYKNSVEIIWTLSCSRSGSTWVTWFSI